MQCPSSSPADQEAAELTEIFYPCGIEVEVSRHGWRRVLYEVLGINSARPRIQADRSMNLAIVAPWFRQSESRNVAARRRSYRISLAASWREVTTSIYTLLPGPRWQAYVWSTPESITAR